MAKLPSLLPYDSGSPFESAASKANRKRMLDITNGMTSGRFARQQLASGSERTPPEYSNLTSKKRVQMRTAKQEKERTGKMGPFVEPRRPATTPRNLASAVSFTKHQESMRFDFQSRIASILSA